MEGFLKKSSSRIFFENSKGISEVSFKGISEKTLRGISRELLGGISEATHERFCKRIPREASEESPEDFF